MLRRSGAEELLWFSALTGADQRKTGAASLDLRTLNLFLPPGRDVIAGGGIKAAMGTCSLLFSGSLPGLTDE